MPRPMPEVQGVTHRDVDAGGVRIHVAEAGAGDPVVLVHGWPQHWYLWRHLIPALAEQYRVVCPDLRGFGWSEAPGDGYNAFQFAADLVAVLDALELEQVKLVGHDWGGIAGFVVALEQPERVERYVAMGTAHPWIRVKPGDLPRFAYQLPIVTPLLGRLVVSRVLEHLARDPVWSDDVRRIYLDQFSERERAAATVKLYRGAIALQITRSLPGPPTGPAALRLTTPTLFLQGSQDPVIKPHMLAGFDDHVEDMRLEVLEGVRHFIPEQVPDLVLDRMLAFFSAAG